MGNFEDNNDLFKMEAKSSLNFTSALTSFELNSDALLFYHQAITCSQIGNYSKCKQYLALSMKSDYRLYECVEMMLIMGLFSEIELSSLLNEIDWTKYPEFYFLKHVYNFMLLKIWDSSLEIFSDDLQICSSQVLCCYDSYDLIGAYELCKKYLII